MANIPVELPPFTTTPELSEYLTRMFQFTQIALVNTNQHERLNTKPIKPRIGKTYYFDAAIASDPDITAEGLYIYKSSGWQIL